MPNIRKCRQCGRMVDFDQPWCDHETMEESAWLDIAERRTEALAEAAKQNLALENLTLEQLIERTALELGYQAGKAQRDMFRLAFDRDELSVEKHRSDLDFVRQHENPIKQVQRPKYI